MNGMTKQRYISTSIWDDDWFDSLSEREKLVYFYLLTNTHTNAAGVYQCTLKNVRLEIGLEREEIERIMGKFAKAGKAFYYKDYIVIPKWLKHQKVGERSTMMLGAEKVLKSLPDDVKAFISDRKHYDWDISEIIGKPSIGYKSPMPNNDEIMDSLCQNNDSLSIAYQNNGIATPENALQTAHDSDLDLDLDSDLDSDLDIDIDLDGDLDPKPITSQCEYPVEKPPPIPLHNFVKEKVKSHGFYIDDPVVKKIISSIPDKSWFKDKHDIITFVAGKINEVYSDKPKEERKKLFVSALTKWENIKDEYPDWLNKKIKDDAERALKLLRDTPPKLCPSCKTDLQGTRRCPSCNGFVFFNEDQKEWIFEAAIEIESLSDMMRNKRKTKQEENVTEDIEF